MKIGIVVPDINFVGGAERVALNLYKFLSNHYEVEVISLFGSNNNIKDLKNIKIRYLDANKPLNLLERIVFRFLFTIKYKSILENFDILIGNNFYRYYSIPIFLKKTKSIEIQHLRYEEELEKFNFKKYVSLKVRNIIYKKLDKLIVLTDRDKAKFLNNGVKNVAVIPNGLSFFPSKKAELNNKVALAIGRLTYQKGFDILINVWGLVAEKHPDWKLCIYGEGPMRNELSNLISKYSLQEQIYLMGNVNNISEVILDSSLMIMTSRYEGFPMILLEAMSCGVPVISFDYDSGPNEIISNYDDGFIIKNNDVEDMVNKICYIIDNSNVRKKMGEQARENIKRYSWEKVGLKWIELLNSL